MLVQQWEELSVCIHRSLGMGIVLFFSSVDLFFFFKCMRYLHNQASAFSLCPCCFCSLLIRNYLEMDGISVKEKELMLLLHRCCIIYIYIYIYAFSRRFYPKRLTVHSGYTCFITMFYHYLSSKLQSSHFLTRNDKDACIIYLPNSSLLIFWHVLKGQSCAVWFNMPSKKSR